MLSRTIKDGKAGPFDNENCNECHGPSKFTKQYNTSEDFYNIHVSRNNESLSTNYAVKGGCSPWASSSQKYVAFVLIRRGRYRKSDTGNGISIFWISICPYCGRRLIHESIVRLDVIGANEHIGSQSISDMPRPWIFGTAMDLKRTNKVSLKPHSQQNT